MALSMEWDLFSGWKRGFANCLEGYSYGENTAAMDLEKLGFAITPFKK
jgi:hypothetical protein